MDSLIWFILDTSSLKLHVYVCFVAQDLNTIKSLY